MQYPKSVTGKSRSHIERTRTFMSQIFIDFSEPISCRLITNEFTEMSEYPAKYILCTLFTQKFIKEKRRHKQWMKK